MYITTAKKTEIVTSIERWDTLTTQAATSDICITHLIQELSGMTKKMMDWQRKERRTRERQQHTGRDWDWKEGRTVRSGLSSSSYISSSWWRCRWWMTDWRDDDVGRVSAYVCNITCLLSLSTPLSLATIQLLVWPALSTTHLPVQQYTLQYNLASSGHQNWPNVNVEKCCRTATASAGSIL